MIVDWTPSTQRNLLHALKASGFADCEPAFRRNAFAEPLNACRFAPLATDLKIVTRLRSAALALNRGMNSDTNPRANVPLGRIVSGGSLILPATSTAIAPKT